MNAQILISALKHIGCKSSDAMKGLEERFNEIDNTLEELKIQNKILWWKHTLAQAGHESVLFSVLQENLFYSTERLMEVWPAHFKTYSEAAKFSRNPKALAERIYGISNPKKAKDLGNKQEGDGWNFRGSGYIQLTGRANFTNAEKSLKIGILENPDLARTHSNSWLILAWYMTTREGMLAAIAKDDAFQVTKLVNGGTNGLQDRIHLTNKLKKYFEIQNMDTPVNPTQIKKPVLEIGDYGEHVGYLQSLLWKNGFPCGKIDKDFGINTKLAVEAFQRAKGLTVDGKVGNRETWPALEAIL